MSLNEREMGSQRQDDSPERMAMAFCSWQIIKFNFFARIYDNPKITSIFPNWRNIFCVPSSEDQIKVFEVTHISAPQV